MPQPSCSRARVIGARQIAGLAGLAGVFILALAAALAALNDNLHVFHGGLSGPGAREPIGATGFVDHLTLYLESGRILSSDRITGIALIAVAGMALTFALALARDGARRHRRAAWMFLLMALGAAYLAADEVLGIHVRIGENLRRLVPLPIGDHPNDVVLLTYAIPAVLFIHGFWREITRSWRSVGAMAVAIAFFLLAVIADLTGSPVEEALELAGALSLAASVLLLGLHHFGQAMTPRARRPTDGLANPD